MLEIVNLTDVIQSGQLTLDCIIGESGSAVSGGQAARVGIARALLGDYGVLVFDESFSSLDEDNANEIIKKITIRRPNTTMIFISHIQTHLMCCDKIFELKDRQLHIVSPIYD